MSIRSVMTNESMTEMKKYNTILKLIFMWEITDANDITAFLHKDFMKSTLNYKSFKSFNHYYLSLLSASSQYKELVRLFFLDDAKKNRDITFYPPLLENINVGSAITAYGLLLTAARNQNLDNFLTLVSLMTEGKENVFLSPVGVMPLILSPLAYFKDFNKLKKFINFIVKTHGVKKVYFITLIEYVTLLEYVVSRFDDTYLPIVEYIISLDENIEIRDAIQGNRHGNVKICKYLRRVAESRYLLSKGRKRSIAEILQNEEI
jgi:hypothetical protein